VRHSTPSVHPSTLAAHDPRPCIQARRGAGAGGLTLLQQGRTRSPTQNRCYATVYGAPGPTTTTAEAGLVPGSMFASWRRTDQVCGCSQVGADSADLHSCTPSADWCLVGDTSHRPAGGPDDHHYPDQLVAPTRWRLPSCSEPDGVGCTAARLVLGWCPVVSRGSRGGSGSVRGGAAWASSWSRSAGSVPG
jgi:hypothetical protein